MNDAAIAWRPIAVATLLLASTLALNAEDALNTEDRPAPASTGVSDPWEGYNRAMFSFNMQVDRAVLRPVANAYRTGVPSPLRTAFANFLDNLGNPLNLVNNLLQGKPLRAGSDLARFVVNLTAGAGGLLDPATGMNLPQSDEDFGQTLGRWGVGPGPYLVLPLVPPGGLRDTLSQFPDQQLDPFTHAESAWIVYGGKAFDIVEARSRLLDLDEAIDQAYDPYRFVRDALSQRRAYKVRDGAAAPMDYDDLYDDPLDEPAEDATAAPPPPER